MYTDQRVNLYTNLEKQGTCCTISTVGVYNQYSWCTISTVGVLSVQFVQKDLFRTKGLGSWEEYWLTLPAVVVLGSGIHNLFTNQ